LIAGVSRLSLAQFHLVVKWREEVGRRKRLPHGYSVA
jgi:hypothetical protein